MTKKVEAGRFEPRNPVLQASPLTPTPEGIAGQCSKNVTIYQKRAVSGFRFQVFERAMVSCFVLHVTCYRKYSFPNHLFHVSSFLFQVSCFHIVILFHVSGLPQKFHLTVFMFPVLCFKFLYCFMFLVFLKVQPSILYLCFQFHVSSF